MANRACAEIARRVIKTFGDRQVPENWLADCELYPLASRGSHVADPLRGQA